MNFALTEALIRETKRDDSYFNDMVKSFLSKPNTSKYIFNCYVSNEVGFNYPIERFGFPADKIYRGAYIGLGPEQNLSYIANFRPEIAIICDTRVENLIWHLLAKLIFELAETPYQFLNILLSREYHDNDFVDDNIDAIFNKTCMNAISKEMFKKNLEYFKNECNKRWSFTSHHEKILEDILDNFFRRQFSICVVNDESERNIGAFVKFKDTLLAKNDKGMSFHFLSRQKYYHVARFLSWYNRIIPIVGSLSDEDSVSEINKIMNFYSTQATCLYLSNIEAYIVDLYTITHDTIKHPNTKGMLTGAYSLYGDIYKSFLNNLNNIKKHDDCLLIRSFMPFEFNGRCIGLPFVEEGKAYLEIKAEFYRMFSDTVSNGINSIFETYL